MVKTPRFQYRGTKIPQASQGQAKKHPEKHKHKTNKKPSMNNGKKGTLVLQQMSPQALEEQFRSISIQACFLMLKNIQDL